VETHEASPHGPYQRSIAVAARPHRRPNSNRGAGKLGLDYRGKGGYIVAAPSITMHGKYRWESVEPDCRGATFNWAGAKQALALAPKS
jgi:Bifunctional DNA primase/polymerase, N-terminal